MRVLVLDHVDVAVARSADKERVFLGLGGNLGDPASSMAAALRILDADPHTSVVAVSSLYRTPPWGKTDQPDFINAATWSATSKIPCAPRTLGVDAEHELKRVRQERWGPRSSTSTPGPSAIA